MKVVHGTPASPQGDLQDGVLAYYLENAKSADVNVDARIACEPFDFYDIIAPSLRPILRRQFKNL